MNTCNHRTFLRGIFESFKEHPAANAYTIVRIYVRNTPIWHGALDRSSTFGFV